MTSLHKVCQNSEASRDLVKRVYDFEKGAATKQDRVCYSLDVVARAHGACNI